MQYRSVITHFKVPTEKMSTGTEEEHIDLRTSDLCTVIRNWTSRKRKYCSKKGLISKKILLYKPKPYKNKYLLFV